MVQNINLNALRMFAVAARHGNFQRAAEVLNLTHSAVSQRMKQLELDLGVVLFQRHARGVSLTPQGQSYLDAVEKALSILATATADLRGTGGQITLHLGSSFAARWLMPRMRDFAARFPDVSITTETHEEPMQRNLGRNEIAIWPGKTTDRNPAHEVRRLAEVDLVAVCSPGLHRPDGPLDTAGVLTLPLLQDAHRRWERLIAETGHRGAPRLLNFDRSALALDAAIDGHGVAIAPTYMIERDLGSGRLVEIWRSPDAAGEHLFMAWSRQHDPSKPLQQTKQWLFAEFRLS